MKRILKKIRQNDFIRVSGTNGMITILKAFVSILANKVVAFYIGTSGVAMTGQLQNLITIVSMVSGGGFGQGITRYAAQYKENRKEIREFVSTAFVFSMSVSLLCGLVVFILSGMISEKIFLTRKYSSIIILLGTTLVLYSLNNMFICIINGLQQYRKYFKINIATTVSGAILSMALVIALREYGALLAIVLSQSVVCLFTWLLIRNDSWVKYLSVRFFSKEKLKQLFKYAVIVLLGAIIWPFVKIMIRSYVITHISAGEAGLWEAASKINDYIAILATGSFSVYLLPKLTSISDPLLLKKEITGIFKVIVPFCLCGFTFIYLFREYIILFLYSPDFMKASDYLLLQMAGSFFWICKIVPMNLLLAKGKINLYLKLEVIFCLMYVTLAYFFVPRYGVQGIQASFAIYNFLYFITNMVWISRIKSNNY